MHLRNITEGNSAVFSFIQGYCCSEMQCSWTELNMSREDALCLWPSCSLKLPQKVFCFVINQCLVLPDEFMQSHSSLRDLRPYARIQSDHRIPSHAWLQLLNAAHSLKAQLSHWENQLHNKASIISLLLNHCSKYLDYENGRDIGQKNEVLWGENSWISRYNCKDDKVLSNSAEEYYIVFIETLYCKKLSKEKKNHSFY